MVRRTKADALTTRTELLDAAERAFSSNGVANTSMMQVAEAAGVTRGAIYHHFQNKLDLINALMDRVKLPVDEMLEEIVQAHQDNPLAILKARCFHIIHQVEHDPHMQALINILLHKCEYVDDALPIHLRHLGGRNACIEESCILLDEAKKKALIGAELNSQAVVLGLFSLVDGLMYNWLLDKSLFDLSSTAKQDIECYFKGLQA